MAGLRRACQALVPTRRTFLATAAAWSAGCAASEAPGLRPPPYEPLPGDVKPRVVVRPGTWLTDEAASTCRRAAAVVSLEMHSPLIAIANGRPAVHLRQPTDTRKGQVWREVGLQDRLFEIDDATGEPIADRLLDLQGQPECTASTVAKAREFTSERGREKVAAVSANL